MKTHSLLSMCIKFLASVQSRLLDSVPSHEGTGQDTWQMQGCYCSVCKNELRFSKFTV